MNKPCMTLALVNMQASNTLIRNPGAYPLSFISVPQHFLKPISDNFMIVSVLTPYWTKRCSQI